MDATPVRAASGGASEVLRRIPAKNTVPENSPMAVSETENSALSVEVIGPMLPAFHEVPAASSAVASVTRAED